MIKEDGDYFLKSDGWRIGDKVICLATSISVYTIGETYTLEKGSGLENRLKIGSWNGLNGTFKRVSSDKAKGLGNWLKEKGL